MEMAEKGNLLSALKEGVVTVVFKKVGTDEIRIMPCSLNQEILDEHKVPTNIKDIDLSTETFAAWAMDKEAWRSFRLSTVVSWEVGYPSESRDV